MVSSITVTDSAGVERTVATADALATLIGEVQASPTANSLLERLKVIHTDLSVGTTTGLTKLEDAVHSSGDAGVMALGVRRDTSASTATTDGDYAAVTLDANGKMWARIGANDMYYTEDAAAASDPIGPVIMGVRRDTLATSEVSSDGDNVAAKMDNLGRLHVNAGGAAAHDAAIAGNPTRLGGRALTANYTGVSTGDTADLITTIVGALITKPFSLPGADWSYAAAASGITNTTTAVTVKAAGAAGLKNYITWIELSTDGAIATASEVAIRDGAGGTVLWRTKIGTAGLATGRTIQLPSPISGTAATLLEVVTLTQFATGTLYFNCGGYVAP